MTGVEALVRWQHPTRGLVCPDQFIPVAQETGLIRPLTLYVIDEALRQSQEWRERGHELAVAVNVSMRNLLDARFPTDIQELLDQRNMPAALLGLEITETAIVADPYRTRAVLERLAAMGIRLAVDDFGTGYTSLAYLKRLPVKELKIDRSFVGNMMHDDDDAVIVRSTIDLGQNLGLEVVAEGVEDAETLAGLEALGCDLAQGYYMSHPIAGDALMKWLECLPASAGDSQWRDEGYSTNRFWSGVGAFASRMSSGPRLARQSSWTRAPETRWRAPDALSKARWTMTRRSMD